MAANGKRIYVGGTTLTRTFMLAIFARLHKCNVRRSYTYIMGRYIILTMHDLSILDSKKNPIDLVRDIAECDEYDCLIVFKSFDEAASYQEENGVSGQIVELPTMA